MKKSLLALAVLAVLTVAFLTQSMAATAIAAAGVAGTTYLFAQVANKDVLADFGQMRMFNDATAVEDLQNRLLDLKDQANNIQARADAEKRDLTEDEQGEIQTIFASFEAVEADIDRRNQLASINDRIAAPQARRTTPAAPSDEVDDPASRILAAPQARSRSVPAQARQTDAGKWGFRSSGEYMSAVIKASVGGSVDPRLIANAASTYGNEGAGADGGYAVPPDFRTTIIQKLMGEDSLLARTDQMTTSSNSITLPKDETTPWQSTGGIQAYWEGEGSQMTGSKPQLGELTVKANKITALVPLSEELLEDAPSMSSYVNRKAPEKIDYKVNDAILNGTGVGMPLGILKSAGTIIVNAESGQAADTVRHANINNMWARLTPAAKRNAVWIVNSDAEALFEQISFRDATSSPVPIYLPPGGISASPYGSLKGRPVITTEASPALGDEGDIILCDMSQYLSVVKTGGIRQDVSLHLYFDQALAAFRFILRVGGQPWWNSPITRPGGQPTRGFFVALGAR